MSLVDANDKDQFFSDVEAAAKASIWCALATVHEGEPRVRMVHPTWEGDTLWIATEGGLEQINPDGSAESFRNISAEAVGFVPAEVLSPGGIAVFEDGRVDNYSTEGDLQRLIGATGTRIRRLAAFVATE